MWDLGGRIQIKRLIEQPSEQPRDVEKSPDPEQSLGMVRME